MLKRGPDLPSKVSVGPPCSQQSPVHNGGMDVERLLDLQRTYGNAFVQRMIQRKLTVSQPGDSYEQEADRVAETVVSMSDNAGATGALDRKEAPDLDIQRACPKCEEVARQAMAPEEEEEKKLHRQKTPEEEEEEKPLQGKAAPGGVQGVSDEVETGISSEVQRGGEPLSASVREFMEPRMGYDLGPVRIHTGAQAGQLARSVNALAFTVGRDVVFGNSQYSPETNEGKRLLAHELTHVVQQTGAGGQLSSKREPPE